MRVLVVDDEKLLVKGIKFNLENDGYEVETAYDGVEAVEKVREAPAEYFDIVLMDVQMPKMDGYEATKQIRALEDPVKANIPIVAVTANAFEEDRKTAMEAGMNGHLAKPYDINEILRTLKEILE